MNLVLIKHKNQTIIVMNVDFITKNKKQQIKDNSTYEKGDKNEKT